MVSKRLKQLKFIANIFNMSLNEIRETLGFETLTMIFCRVGEASAENVVKRLKGKYETIEEFGQLLIENVIEPVLGENKSTVENSEGKVKISLDACPYKRSGGFKIQEMGFFCHYTEGLFDNAYKLAFPDKTVFTEPVGLIADKCKNCTFDIEIE